MPVLLIYWDVIRGGFIYDHAKHTAIGDLHPSIKSICKVIDAPPWFAYPSIL